MTAPRFSQCRWIAGISGLIFTFGASSLVAQTYGSYGMGSPNPPQTYGQGQQEMAPPPPDETVNAPYGNQPYAATPGYGAQGYAENGNYPRNYPSNSPPPSYPPHYAPNAAPNYPPNYSGNYPANDGAGYGEPNSQPAQALSPDQLEQLIAPIALDPDTLIAQILAAATWPQQIIEADPWRQAQGDAPPEAIAAGANAQDWDPSVKALTAFPQVLQQMDQNLQWTTELGNAYYNEPDAVLGTVQTLRERAQAAGTLENSPQETVSDNDGYIQLAPPNPNVVYVPAYDPWTAYGQPIAPWPGFSLLSAVGNVLGPALQYGVGSVLSAFTPFGWLGWGLNWLMGGLFFHGSGWAPHNAALMDWGLPYGGPRWNWREGGGRGWDRGYGRGYDREYGRGGYGGGYRDRSMGGLGYARGSGLDPRGIYHGPARPIGNGFGGRDLGGRQIEGVRGAYAVRGGGYGGRGSEYGRGQQAWNRSPSFGGRTDYGRESYGSGFAGRAGSAYRSQGGSYGSRTARGFGSQGFRGTSLGSRGGMTGFRGGGSTVARNFGGESAMRGGYGNGDRGGSTRSFSEHGFSGSRGSSHASGFRGFSGGGHASRSFSGHSHFGGGGHFGGSSHGGGHSHGGGGHSHGGGGHRR
ncbi:MAG TPA: DUF3300 domain-containing protein [Acidobacteriaceae bacterium]|jgi:hypothetical protein|nr:DUF3300 domain-containing protein [Acidobacteriaceae bacterium]